MIISDKEFHKIDVKYQEDGFLRITTFHSKDNGATWITKQICLSPETQIKLVNFILHRADNKDDNQRTETT